MENCIFCKIANGEIPSNKVYEDDQVLAFYDLDPQAPVHVLIIPKAHYDSILAVPCGKDNPLPAMTAAAQKIAQQLGVAETGFRLVINTGKDGGQSVQHLHMHLLGGREFAWPAG